MYSSAALLHQRTGFIASVASSSLRWVSSSKLRFSLHRCFSALLLGCSFLLYFQGARATAFGPSVIAWIDSFGKPILACACVLSLMSCILHVPKNCRSFIIFILHQEDHWRLIPDLLLGWWWCLKYHLQLQENKLSTFLSTVESRFSKVFGQLLF